jgi:hypothetical protein
MLWYLCIAELVSAACFNAYVVDIWRRNKASILLLPPFLLTFYNFL